MKIVASMLFCLVFVYCVAMNDFYYAILVCGVSASFLCRYLCADSEQDMLKMIAAIVKAKVRFDTL